MSEPVRRRPLDVDLVAPEDLVLITDASGMFYARVRGRTPHGGFAVAPVARLNVTRKVARDAIVDHWQRAPRPPAMPDTQLTIPLAEHA